MRRVAIAVLLALGCLTIAAPAIAATPTIPDETFAGVSTPSGDWVMIGAGNLSPSTLVPWVPCLTAATTSTPGSIPACAVPLDPVGDGALRLTENEAQGGFAMLDTPIDTSLGLQIEFDFFQYDAVNPGDGMAFFLIDGAVTPTQAGTFGGGMGYASYHPTGSPGLAGGYVGIAFDTYGAFSDPGIGGGGSGVFTPNAIAVRGNATSDYYLLSSHVAAGPLAVPLATDRDDAVRHVVVTISKLNVMSIDVDYGGGLISEITGLDLETINGPGSLPSSLKLGFTGSTGGAYSVHEIRNFEIQTLAPNLALSIAAGSVDPTTQNGRLTLNVTNAATTGATDGIITVTSTLPTGVAPTAASGPGWTCTLLAQLVSCTRSGTGADRLQAGEAAPPITVDVHVADLATLPVGVTATSSVLDDSSAANDSGAAVLALGALAATSGIASPWVLVLALALGIIGFTLVRRAPRRS